MIRLLRRCTLLLLLLAFAGCHSEKEKEVQRSFYYWKSVFRLSPKERSSLQQLSVQHLYIKLFDVVWNSETQLAEPAATIKFSEPIPSGIKVVPVVFITNESLRKLDQEAADTLAVRIAHLASAITTFNHLPLENEVQIDCDWTAGTRDIYFYLLRAIKKQEFLSNRLLSATVRLHQLKFVSEMGVPPVDKGLLMCYNMGDLYYPDTHNSIIEADVLKKYINRLDTYPLSLNIAMPIFDWYVLFDQNKYKGLIHTDDLKGVNFTKEKVNFEQDTIISGISFKKDEWLRHEKSPVDEVKKCARLISKKIKYSNIDIILYHLDEKNLTNYDIQKLESIYNSFR